MASKTSGRKGLIKKVVIAAIIILVIAFIGYQRFATGNSKLAATVNGEDIYKEEVLREYLKVPQEYRSVITTESILQGMIIETLLLQEAAKREISTPDEEVDEFISQLLASYSMTQEDLVAMLEESGSTLEELKVAYNKKLTINKLLNETVLSEIEVTETEARNYYDQNQDKFFTQESIRASHILVNTSSEATSIRNKALGGMSFEELAKQYSICPSASQGGDLGWFSSGQMIKEFEDAAFSLKDIGSISPVVKTQFGYHIIKLTGKKPESTQSFGEVKEQITKDLLSYKQTTAIELYTLQLKSAAKIEIFMKPTKEEAEGTPINEIIAQQKAEQGSEQQEPAATETEAPAEAGSEETGAEQTAAECLASKGARMYGSETSAMSAEQKALFGEGFSEIDYVDCSAEKETCKEAGIISYPTWIINGKKYPGKYSAERLTELAGC